MCETLGPIPSTKKIRSEIASLPLLDLKALPTQNTGVGMWGGRRVINSSLFSINSFPQPSSPGRKGYQAGVVLKELSCPPFLGKVGNQCPAVIRPKRVRNPAVYQTSPLRL
jgi:hypothetical protein